jgi:uncharacterized membrane protein YgaE (UPF0421/DUF939 family)
MGAGVIHYTTTYLYYIYYSTITTSFLILVCVFVCLSFFGKKINTSNDGIVIVCYASCMDSGFPIAFLRFVWMTRFEEQFSLSRVVVC